MTTAGDTLTVEELLSDLRMSLAELRNPPPIDDVARKNAESEYTIRIKLLEQLLHDRELHIHEQAQVDERALRDRELRIKENTSNIERWANPLTVGVLVAALGLIGNFVNGLWTNLNQRAQLENQRVTERIKLENDLIKEAIKPTAEQDRAKSLVFFAKNRLISLEPEVIRSLAEVAGTDTPVPGSSSSIPSSALPITYQRSLVEKIRSNPGLPAGVPQLKRDHAHEVLAIVLHDAVGPDASEVFLKNGRADLRGPFAHWLVKSDGAIVLIALESQNANHLGRARDGLNNSNTIGIMVSGQPALADERQVESLVRLTLDICARWGLPPDKVFSHAEVALPPGRKIDMLQQAPKVRDMVRAVTSPTN